ncbi:hypothetical protein CEE37_07405 [candidate division LCP-89 bacterium B3_LCP]|uniref:Dipeptidylpeptidase IV N-terminal domain-containing protein n=1 Tax=candidate division LCP-89 bacterium B3_LCP TaxID=2012998 RepID=A0A532V0X6_UNCL8|nr:MAG: hypothetical protein CEE37_07405 [candidate division LCP-89 bacterium B3_LCP]
MTLMNRDNRAILISGLFICLIFISGCTKESATESSNLIVPHEERWGIYSLNRASEEVQLLYSSTQQMVGLRLSNDGTRFAFAHRIDGDSMHYEEICTVDIDGSNFERLNQNNHMDTYPSWSPDDSQIAYLSWPGATLDIYLMNSDGTGVSLLYDSGSHDADIDWLNDKITYTQDSQIWMMDDDGSNPTQITDPPNAGQWGNANLPFGDYDPRFHPDGTKIVFERLVDDSSVHGNYEIFTIDTDGSNEIQLTNTGYSQGLQSWSHDGSELVFIVAAIGTTGQYDIYMMNADGSDYRNVTPTYFPPEFLCHKAVFSSDDSSIYFIGEWWE